MNEHGEPLGFDDHEQAYRNTAERSRTKRANGKAETSAIPDSENSIPGWPEALSPAALPGLAGEIVSTIEPASEADPAALLAQLLIAFGNVVGHRPHFRCESTRHTMNLFGVLVGVTAKARKGSSWSRIRELLSDVDAVWANDRIQSGLSSGEGLIEAVRDPKESGEKDSHIDEGVKDKRLLVQQGEFSSVLKVMEREGNILSAIARDAWDSGHLRTMTRKNNALRATGAHISVVGHITRDELRRFLSETDQANGFANRFLWFAVKRSKLLPHGGTVDAEQFRGLSERLKNAVELAQKVGELTRDGDANRIWETVYPDLSEGCMGMLGAVTSRAEAQVVRLSCLYALLDRSSVIRREHMNAALAVWRYCEDSARYIFGDALGDPVADAILAALKESREGLTRNDIREMFGRNKSSERIGHALALLQEQGKVAMRKEQTDGRPREVWFAVTGSTP
jgi:hypothetical protein